MSALGAMRALLRGTGLYALSGETVVDAELCAYAIELERLRERMDEVLREALVETADDRGLSVWESLMGEPDRSMLATDRRREMIFYRLGVMPWDFSRKGLVAALQSVGLDGDVIEEGGGTIRIVENSYTGLRQTNAMIERDCRRLLPAHLDCVFDIGSFTFELFDGKDYAWEAWDELDETWDRIETVGSQL